MGTISERADRFVRQVFLKKDSLATPQSPAQAQAMKRMERAAAARKRAVQRRKGY